MAENVTEQPNVEAQAEAEPKPLPTFENYDVFELLATGGMGSIYAAMRHGTSRLCVIKTLNAEYAENDIVFARFLREAQVAALFDHPNISRLSDAKIQDDQLFIAMDFIAGQDLESLMFKLMRQKKMLPPALSLTVAEQVLRGLHYAHEFKTGDEHLQVVHRDLSPRNIMLTFDGGVQIIDFGLARAQVGEFRTAARMVMGTLRYMSPEQALGERVDRRSDIYTLGTVLYENLTGRPFIRGEKHTDVLPEILQRQPIRFEELELSLPAGLSEVVLKAMHKEAKHRFQTAEEFRVALVEAAGPYCSTPADQIGEFLRSQFPEEHAEASARIERIEGNAANETLPRDAPELIHTRIGMAPQPGEDVPMPALAPIEQSESMQFERTQSVDRARLAIEASSDAFDARPVEPPPAPKKSPLVPLAIALSLVAAAIVFFVVRAGPTEASPEPTETTAVTPPPPPQEIVEVVERAQPVEDDVEPKRDPPTKRTRRTVPPPPPPPPPTDVAKAPPPEVAKAPPPSKSNNAWRRSIEAQLARAEDLSLDDKERRTAVMSALERVEAQAKARLKKGSVGYEEVVRCTTDHSDYGGVARDAIECYSLLKDALEGPTK